MCQTFTGYAITRAEHCFQFQQASLASDRSGVSGVHQWSVMLPTCARVAQEVYEPLIGVQHPMLCSCKNGRWQTGTGSIRLNEQKPTGLVQWIHHDPREANRADPPPESTRAVCLQIESWPPVQADEPDNILVLTTRKDSASSLCSFCHQSRRNTNVETAVKVAGATAKHCVVLHGQSSFLSGHSNRSDFDKECYTTANVALSRATDLTVLACPLNMHGLEGAAQVIAALLPGACTLHTSDTVPGTCSSCARCLQPMPSPTSSEGPWLQTFRRQGLRGVLLPNTNRRNSMPWQYTSPPSTVAASCVSRMHGPADLGKSGCGPTHLNRSLPDCCFLEAGIVALFLLSDFNRIVRELPAAANCGFVPNMCQ